MASGESSGSGAYALCPAAARMQSCHRARVGCRARRKVYPAPFLSGKRFPLAVDAQPVAESNIVAPAGPPHVRVDPHVSPAAADKTVLSLEATCAAARAACRCLSHLPRASPACLSQASRSGSGICFHILRQCAPSCRVVCRSISAATSWCLAISRANAALSADRTAASRSRPGAAARVEPGRTEVRLGDGGAGGGPASCAAKRHDSKAAKSSSAQGGGGGQPVTPREDRRSRACKLSAAPCSALTSAAVLRSLLSPAAEAPPPRIKACTSAAVTQTWLAAASSSTLSSGVSLTTFLTLDISRIAEMARLAQMPRNATHTSGRLLEMTAASGPVLSCAAIRMSSSSGRSRRVGEPRLAMPCRSGGVRVGRPETMIPRRPTVKGASPSGVRGNLSDSPASPTFGGEAGFTPPVLPAAVKSSRTSVAGARSLVKSSSTRVSASVASVFLNLPKMRRDDGPRSAGSTRGAVRQPCCP
eukprot:scaffold2559_cov103-Isochrysis_galbana.AAC.2